jgi:4-amino-4-deoxy-L-arabinose transferase-like glycosyltransferase
MSETKPTEDARDEEASAPPSPSSHPDGDADHEGTNGASARAVPDDWGWAKVHLESRGVKALGYYYRDASTGWSFRVVVDLKAADEDGLVREVARKNDYGGDTTLRLAKHETLHVEGEPADVVANHRAMFAKGESPGGPDCALVLLLSEKERSALNLPEQPAWLDAYLESAPKGTKDSKDAADAATPKADDLIPRGNPLRLKRGLVTTLAGAVPALLLMAKNGQNAWGIPLGTLCVLVASWGVMDLLGTFDDDEATVATRTTFDEVKGPLLRTVAMVVAFAGALAAAQSAIGPWWLGAVTVTGTFLAFVASVFDLGRAIGPWKTDETGEERPLLQRHGFWVVAIGAVLYFPAMGLQSLWDPWETHYGEVAREILSKDDWISLWWAQDGWFWSKPVLNFWIQSLAMGSLGTHYHPDQMLLVGSAAVAHPEWAVRAPNVLMTIAAMYLLYKGVAKVFGRRAGLLGALVLATMPDWFFLAHQTMTDMPFVSAMTAAMGLLLYGLNTEVGTKVRVYEVDAFGSKWRLSLWHLVFGAVLVCAIPQILYLISRNIELVVFGDGPKGFRIHWDEFRSGSGGGNCGLPGNEACTMHSPASVPKSVGPNPDGFTPSLIRYFGGMEPSLQGILWAALIGALLWLNWGERRTRRIVYVAAWLAAAIATMAKGPAGFGLPMVCAFAYVATKKRWTELLRLEMLSGTLIILAVAIPWYVAMYVRHGSPFTDRLIFHDMFNRAFSHVHDTNEGDDTGIRYYIWQLGYALYPWTALAPLGLVWSFRRSDSAVSRRSAVGDASVMLVMWFLFAFALFSFMGTKFHHYIFPAVPPVAMLIGVVLDEMLGDAPLVRTGTFAKYAAGLTLGTAIATWGVSRFFWGNVVGAAKATATPGELSVSEPSVVVAIVVTAIGLAIAAAAAMSFRAGDDGAKEDRERTHEGLMLGGAAVVGGLALFLVGRDLVIKPDGSDQPGAIRLLQLFTYNYRRPWPDSLNFEAILGGFTGVGALIAFAMGAKRWRRHAIAAFCAFAMVWGAWGLDVYMVKLSPHWGQHEVIETYYRDRKGPEEMLVAYQMNWKGENFYTGNHVPAFVSSGANFTNWLHQQRDKGAKVMYFITEHGRIGGLRGEVGAKSFKELTDKTLCNKFVLVRAEL